MSKQMAQVKMVKQEFQKDSDGIISSKSEKG